MLHRWTTVFVCFFLIITMQIFIPCELPEPGDVDGDLFITSHDAALVAQYLATEVMPFSAHMECADCNGQEGIDAADVVWIINHKTLIEVPTATFDMGDAWEEVPGSNIPVHSVTLSAHEISPFMATNAQFCYYLNEALAADEITVMDITGLVQRNNAGGAILFYTYPVEAMSQITFDDGTQTFSVRTRDGYPMDDHPAVDVTWYGAAALCNWCSRQAGYQEVYDETPDNDWPSDLSRNGYRLPTEAEWEQAAAWDPTHSGSTNYPLSVGEAAQHRWRFGFRSDTIDQTRANYEYDSDQFSNPLGLTTEPYTSPVGYYNGVDPGTVDSRSYLGCCDMSGNWYEWCNDFWSFDYYSVSPTLDPPGPSASTGLGRVSRGGTCLASWLTCRSSSRELPGGPAAGYGFRVARRP
jgi:formylglycine-generating enzyme required for sulfatase activity